jgi:hypothetical protein
MRAIDALKELVGLARRCERCGVFYTIKLGHRADVCDWVQDFRENLRASRGPRDSP